MSASIRIPYFFLFMLLPTILVNLNEKLTTPSPISVIEKMARFGCSREFIIDLGGEVIVFSYFILIKIVTI